MAEDWLEISSDEYDSSCGQNEGFDLVDALDGTNYWAHSVSETHWFIIDLGQTYTITKFRGRSQLGIDPIDVDIYVSDIKGTWGTAVAEGISTWQDTSDWAEVDSTDKDGRYIYVEVIDSEYNHWCFWGNGASPFTIFDAYGDISSPPIDISPPDLIILSSKLGQCMNIQTSKQSNDIYINTGTY